MIPPMKMLDDHTLKIAHWLKEEILTSMKNRIYKDIEIFLERNKHIIDNFTYNSIEISKENMQFKHAAWELTVNFWKEVLNLKTTFSVWIKKNWYSDIYVEPIEYRDLNRYTEIMEAEKNLKNLKVIMKEVRSSWMQISIFGQEVI